MIGWIKHILDNQPAHLRAAAWAVVCSEPAVDLAPERLEALDEGYRARALKRLVNQVMKKGGPR